MCIVGSLPLTVLNSYFFVCNIWVMSKNYWDCKYITLIYRFITQFVLFFNFRKKQSSSTHAASHVTESLTELRQTLAASLKSSEDTTKTLGRPLLN